MAFGPVLRYELLTTSRRPRYYAARFLYGLILLLFLFQSYETYQINRGLNNINSTQTSLRFLAESMFATIAGTQAVALLLLTPAMVAGVIADEARRKTLHDLLASGMTSTSIVVGKLSARLIHALILIAIGLPVIAIIELLGGLDPTLVMYVYLSTLSTVLATGSLSILVSVLARSPREAILGAYALTIAWIIAPMMMATLLRHLIWPLNYLDYVNQYLLWSNPLYTWSTLSSLSIEGQYNRSIPNPWVATLRLELESRFQWVIGLQGAVGTFALICAVLLLRPVRGFGDGSGTIPWKRLLGKRANSRIERSRVLIAPRHCGDAPMLWKERRVSLRGGLAWVASRPTALVLGTLLGCYLFEASKPAFGEIIDQIQGIRTSDHFRIQMNEMIREISIYMFCLWGVVVACAGAVSVTEEKESDTWISLTATLLTGREIITGKIFGAMWSARWIGLAMLSMIATGVCAGAIHPLGGLLSVMGLFIYGAFAAALGTAISLRARTSPRGLLFTVTALVSLNVGMLIALAVLRINVNGDKTIALIAVSPFVEFISLFSYQDLRDAWSQTNPRALRMDFSYAVVMITLSFAVHMIATCAMAIVSIRNFEKAIDRPRRGFE